MEEHKATGTGETEEIEQEAFVTFISRDEIEKRKLEKKYIYKFPECVFASMLSSGFREGVTSEIKLEVGVETIEELILLLKGDRLTKVYDFKDLYILLKMQMLDCFIIKIIPFFRRCLSEMDSKKTINFLEAIIIYEEDFFIKIIMKEYEGRLDLLFMSAKNKELKQFFADEMVKDINKRYIDILICSDEITDFRVEEKDFERKVKDILCKEYNFIDGVRVYFGLHKKCKRLPKLKEITRHHICHLEKFNRSERIEDFLSEDHAIYKETELSLYQMRADLYYYLYLKETLKYDQFIIPDTKGPHPFKIRQQVLRTVYKSGRRK